MKHISTFLFTFLFALLFLACNSNKTKEPAEPASAPDQQPPTPRFVEVPKATAESMIKFFNTPNHIPGQSPDLSLPEIPKVSLLSMKDMKSFTRGNNDDSVRLFIAAYLPNQQPPLITKRNTILVQVQVKIQGSQKEYKYYDLRRATSAVKDNEVTDAVCPQPPDCSAVIN